MIYSRFSPSDAKQKGNKKNVTPVASSLVIAVSVTGELHSHDCVRTGNVEQRDESTCSHMRNTTCTNVNKPFSFLSWNVNGLMSKISDSDFISYLYDFDFVCLVETFMKECQTDVFPGFKTFC